MIRKNINKFLKIIIFLNIVTISVYFSSLNAQKERKSNDYIQEFGTIDDVPTDLKIGNYFLNESVNHKAVIFFLKAYSENKNDPSLNYKLGESYLGTCEKQKCLKYFQRAKTLDPDVAGDIDYKIGLGYHLNYQFDSALMMYNAYYDKIKGSSDEKVKQQVRRSIDQCNTAKRLVSDRVSSVVYNIGDSINSEFPEYRPILSNKETILFYTSRRNNTTGGAIDEKDFYYYEDVYSSQKTDGEWGEGKLLSSFINSAYHNAFVGNGIHGSQVVVFNGKKNGGDLFYMRYNGKDWSDPVAFPKEINTRWRESCGCFSRTGDTLFFISNREDKSLGGDDIYFSHRYGRNKWTEPVNLGEKINTPYDEYGISIAPSGKTLYFASKGHENMGGYDIFKVEMTIHGWPEPQNMGYPVNTPFDDLFYIMSFDQCTGYFSSNREGGEGNFDIYYVHFCD
jgi:tetratricopeptide (TPR) repeat protein